MNDVYRPRYKMSSQGFKCMFIIYSMNKNPKKLTIVLGFCMVFKPNLFIFKRLVDQFSYDNSIELLLKVVNRRFEYFRNTQYHK